MVNLPWLIDGHGRAVIVMERADTYIVTAFPLQLHITADHIHNIISGAYFLYQLL